MMANQRRTLAILVGFRGFVALARLLKRSKCRLRSLRLAGSGGVGVSALVPALCRNTTLHRLELQHNRMPDAECSQLMQALAGNPDSRIQVRLWWRVAVQSTIEFVWSAPRVLRLFIP